MECFNDFKTTDPLHITSFRSTTIKDVASIIQGQFNKIGMHDVKIKSGSGKDSVQMDKRNEADTFITQWWLPKTSIDQGIAKVFNEMKKEYLNDLNVFPVPDGDTGLNMTITMSKVVEELEKADDLSIKNAAKAIAKGAFVGAKGNSGVILSQFFVGFAKSIEDKDSITTEIFANALVSGSERAYKAVTNPKEGTILTVVKETADEALLKATEGLSWKEVVEACYNRAQKATADTPNLLKDLKDAGVIDAGALGFVYLIQGWLFVIANSFVS